MVKIGSVTAEIWWTLSFCGGWGGWVRIYSHFRVQPPTIVGLRLRCSWVGVLTIVNDGFMKSKVNFDDYIITYTITLQLGSVFYSLLYDGKTMINEDLNNFLLCIHSPFWTVSNDLEPTWTILNYFKPIELFHAIHNY